MRWCSPPSIGATAIITTAIAIGTTAGTIIIGITAGTATTITIITAATVTTGSR